MRTLIDLVDKQIEGLDSVAKQEKRSRASVIREAVDEYLARRPATPIDDAFGIWRDRQIEGLDYQNRLRDEW